MLHPSKTWDGWCQVEEGAQVVGRCGASSAKLGEDAQLVKVWTEHECREAGKGCTVGRDLPKQLATFPTGFPIDFACRKVAEKIKN